MSPAAAAPPAAGAPTRRPAARAAAALAHAACAAVAALVLLAVAQPLQTDDAWWHLALGRAYASEGPWLSGDPLLHTAAAPPEPAAWLFDLSLHALGDLVGFPGLRVFHAALAAGILAAVWGLARRTGVSAAGASLATAAFAALSAYRLFQLRPELATIAATLALYRWLLEEARPPSARRVAAATLLLALWANLHSGFLLGPILIATAIAGLAVAAALGPPEARAADLARARRLLLALGLGLAATLLNPTVSDSTSRTSAPAPRRPTSRRSPTSGRASAGCTSRCRTCRRARSPGRSRGSCSCSAPRSCSEASGAACARAP